MQLSVDAASSGDPQWLVILIDAWLVNERLTKSELMMASCS